MLYPTVQIKREANGLIDYFGTKRPITKKTQKDQTGKTLKDTSNMYIHQKQKIATSQLY